MSNDTMNAVGLTIEELAPEARFNLRVREAERATVGAALGLSLEAPIGTLSTGEGCSALCVGPDEWVISGPAETAAALVQACGDVYDAAPHSLVEISDRDVLIRVSGSEVMALLATGIARDLTRMAPGQGARTVFEGTPVVLLREADDSFRMAVWRSFAGHLLSHLKLAKSEIEAGF